MPIKVGKFCRAVGDVRVEYGFMKLEGGGRERDVEHVLALFKHMSLAQVRREYASDPTVRRLDRQGGILEMLWVTHILSEQLGLDVAIGACLYHRDKLLARFDLVLYVSLTSGQSAEILYAVNTVRKASTLSNPTGGIDELYSGWYHTVRKLMKHRIYVRELYIIETDVHVRNAPHYADIVHIKGTFREDYQKLEQLVEELRERLSLKKG